MVYSHLGHESSPRLCQISEMQFSWIRLNNQLEFGCWSCWACRGCRNDGNNTQSAISIAHRFWWWSNANSNSLANSWRIAISLIQFWKTHSKPRKTDSLRKIGFAQCTRIGKCHRIYIEWDEPTHSMSGVLLLLRLLLCH